MDNAERVENYECTRAMELLEYGYYRITDKLNKISLKDYETLEDYNREYSYLKDLLRRIKDELNFYNKQLLIMEIKDSADYYNITNDRVGEKEKKVDMQIERIKHQIKIMKKY